MSPLAPYAKTLNSRSTAVAPGRLANLSKATLCDLLWDLARVAPDCESCDDPVAVLKVLVKAAKDGMSHLGIPKGDVKVLTKLLADVEAMEVK